ETDTTKAGNVLYTAMWDDRGVGLYLTQNRAYDTTTARWLQSDQDMFAASDSNLYRYCWNNPITNTDPSGSQGKPVLPFDVVEDKEAGPHGAWDLQFFKDMGVITNKITITNVNEVYDLGKFGKGAVMVEGQKIGDVSVANINLSRTNSVVEAPERRSGSFAITYVGKRATDLRVVQFFWVDAKVKLLGQEWAQYTKDDAIQTAFGIVNLTTDPNRPKYYIDGNGPGPTYRSGRGFSGGAQAGDRAIFTDRPTLPMFWALRLRQLNPYVAG